jgi:hypothetical protein
MFRVARSNFLVVTLQLHFVIMASEAFPLHHNLMRLFLVGTATQMKYFQLPVERIMTSRQVFFRTVD